MPVFDEMRSAGTVAENAADALANLKKIRSSLSPEATAWQEMLLGLAKDYAPQYAQLSNDLYQKYGPELAKTDSAIARQTYLSDLATARAAGPDYVAAEEAMSPDYVAARRLTSAGLDSLISGMDPNRLSGSEMENVIRGVNRTNVGRGTAGTGSNTATLENVSTFGDALVKKKAAFSSALSTATNFLNPSRTANVPSFRPNNFGVNTQYQGIPQNLTQLMNSWGQSLYNTGSQGALAGQFNQGLLSQIGKVAGTVGQVAGAVGGIKGAGGSGSGRSGSGESNFDTGDEFMSSENERFMDSGNGAPYGEQTWGGTDYGNSFGTGGPELGGGFGTMTTAKKKKKKVGLY